MITYLALTALAGALACVEVPAVLPDAVALRLAPATDSVTLAYICGNMFRIRNAAFEPRDVRWDIYNAVPADSGALRLRGRDVGATYVDYFVTARTPIWPVWTRSHDGASKRRVLGDSVDTVRLRVDAAAMGLIADWAEMQRVVE